MNSRMTFLFVQYLLTFILIMLAFYFNSQLRFMLNTPPVQINGRLLIS